MVNRVFNNSCNCQPKIEPHHQFKNEPPINVLNMVDGSFT